MLEIYERDENGGFTLVSVKEFFAFIVKNDDLFNEFKDIVFESFMDESFIENFSDEEICWFDIHFDKVGLFILIKLIGYYEDENVFIFNEEDY